MQNSSDTNPKARVDSEKHDPIDCKGVSLLKSKLTLEQENDPELASLFKLVLPPVDLDKVLLGYYVRNGVLMRKWRPPNVAASEGWSVIHQIVVPKVYQGGKVSVSSSGRKNKLQAKDLGSYLVTQRVVTLHWTISNCDRRHLTNACEVSMVKSYLKKRDIT